MAKASDASKESRADSLLQYHMSLLSTGSHQQELGEAITTPIFTMPVLEHIEALAREGSQESLSQYGFLAGISEGLSCVQAVNEQKTETQDIRVFHNITAPSSTFICGSQGSGKSHTLSCLLENYLIPSKVNKLPQPLTGILFHYDSFISDDGGSPCEAAFLSSDPRVKVRVLCSPTNIHTIKRTYAALSEVQVEPLVIKENHLNTKRMLDIMAVSQDDASTPLYVHTIKTILRNMRIAQQEIGGMFSYSEFKRQLDDNTSMTAHQLAPLKQRLDTLESFMSKSVTRKGKQNLGMHGNDWTPQPGCLTIVDLSCPTIPPESACSLFNICLSIFLEQKITCGRVIALDEAHKYMNTSAEASTLTNTLLSTIRLQRHLGARIIISTQEPTISPALLDLSSVCIVHRFTSPAWLQSLKAHLAGVASNVADPASPGSNEEMEVDDDRKMKGRKDSAVKVFSDIVKLKAGEALIFSPSAMIGLEKGPGGEIIRMKRLGATYLKVRVRLRLTTDGGQSVMAS